ncbi:MAG: beta-lactamase family protein [Bacteroidetes bacterium]|nr:beta-lactamase family protein [Bacteroidota bacterium]
MKRLLVALLSGLSFLGYSQSLEDTLALRNFMDGIIQTHLRDKHIAGATVSVIKDGRILLKAGYGFSDEKKQRKVSPDSTLFRIGSISKMFTWMSVMQLVAEGKLNLEEDVNHYLKDFTIPATYEKPVTLHDLMTHTPGFEDKVIGLFGRDSTTLKPLSEILSREMPARVRPAGTFASYSNHGTGIAAYIVEQVSGMSFNDYVEQHILNPLGMNLTTFRQPLPTSLKPHMSTGYEYKGGELKAQTFEYVPLFPVGAAASTAVDMTHFMQAILGNGRFKQFQMVDSATLALMESPAHRHHPDVNPMRYGFMDLSQNGVTVIGHGGDTFWFHSLMVMIPSRNVGLFVSFNTNTGGGTYLTVLDQFMERYFPESSLRPVKKFSAEYLKKFAGAYRGNRYSYFDITTIVSLFGDVKISVRDSTALRMASGENVRYLVPVDSLTFREEHSSKVVAFKKDSSGNISNMFVGQLPIFALDKVQGLRSLSSQTTIFLISTIVLLCVLFYWPLAYISRRGYQRTTSYSSVSGGAKWIAWLNYFLLLSFYLGLMIVISDQTDIVYGISGSLKFVLILPLICILLNVLMIYQSLNMWRSGQVKLSSRWYYLLITLVSVVSLWQLNYWNFIGFHY